MHCCNNAPEYFATAVSYERKMFMTLAPGRLAALEVGDGDHLQVAANELEVLVGAVSYRDNKDVKLVPWPLAKRQ